MSNPRKASVRFDDASIALPRGGNWGSNPRWASVFAIAAFELQQGGVPQAANSFIADS
jgi:hypothetical protein